jgi:ribosomal subunit interface protein
MKIQFPDRQAKISKELRAHVEGRLALALGKFGERIERVTVRFSQLAGEKCCQLELAIRARLIKAEGSHGNDAYAASDHAISRASSAVDRVLEREGVL